MQTVVSIYIVVVSALMILFCFAVALVYFDVGARACVLQHRFYIYMEIYRYIFFNLRRLFCLCLHTGPAASLVFGCI